MSIVHRLQKVNGAVVWAQTTSRRRHVTQTDVILEAHHLLTHNTPLFIQVKADQRFFIQLSICGGLLSK